MVDKKKIIWKRLIKQTYKIGEKIVMLLNRKVIIFSDPFFSFYLVVDMKRNSNIRNRILYFINYQFFFIKLYYLSSMLLMYVIKSIYISLFLALLKKKLL